MTSTYGAPTCPVFVLVLVHALKGKQILAHNHQNGSNVTINCSHGPVVSSHGSVVTLEQSDQSAYVFCCSVLARAQVTFDSVDHFLGKAHIS